ncbi:ferritin-like domain-containing protein [Chryseolinea soli]|uniref:Ferritin-like domain-containing protein n=2 Tax=Chryseolinea soli TaxID=2321403 RepID=A0A385SDS8_9BACT|nr:ferritin-like domain-containing protein [Chryseolinea soli]
MLMRTTTKSKAAVSMKRAPARKKAIKSSKENLEDIFEDQLRDIYWAEKHLTKALPKMARAAFNDELREAFNTHLDETRMQIVRLEKCFELLEKKAMAKKCEAMQGLVEEGEEAIEEYDEGHARDAALIAAGQKVEHYEISAYGTLRTMANVLGKTQCAQLLEETKEEEAQTDVKLTRLAEKINHLAAEMQEEEVE